MANKSLLQEAQVAISKRVLCGEAPIAVTSITDRCLYSVFFGTLDSLRIKNLINSIRKIHNHNEHNMMIIELSHVETIDDEIAASLKKLHKSLDRIGIELVYCGIKPVVAASMNSVGIALDDIIIEKNLKHAITVIYEKQGLKLVPIE